MKKKGIILSIIGLILVSSLLVIIVNKTNKKYIMQDGAMFALTLDGKLISKFPEGTNYHVNIECTNATGTWLVEEWKLSLEDITGNVTCNIDFTTRDSNDKLVSVVESAIPNNNFNDNGYRYTGKQPNNYIWFNNEMWRIIGSIPTCTSSGCSTSTNLVKIIRNDSIGGLVYDAVESGYATWGSNSLYSLLNTHYYATSESNLNGQNHSGCYGYKVSSVVNCNYTDIGILSTSYHGKMVKNVYWNTGAVSSDAIPSTAYSSETTTQTVSGYVGLMNVSDYTYSAGSNYSSKVITSGLFGNNSWLFGKGSYREFISTNDSTNNVYAIFQDSTLSINSTVMYGASIRPVVYLDSNVYVVSGDGSITYPYQIAM